MPQVTAPKHSLTVIGRRWFSSRCGNTYHTVQILVDGVTVHKSPVTYGYGSQYHTTAAAWLKKHGYIPDDGRSLWGYFRDHLGLNYESSCSNVARKKDL